MVLYCSSHIFIVWGRLQGIIHNLLFIMSVVHVISVSQVYQWFTRDVCYWSVDWNFNLKMIPLSFCLHPSINQSSPWTIRPVMLQPKSLTNIEEFVSIPALYSESFNFQSAQTIQTDMFYGFFLVPVFVCKDITTL